MPSTKNGDEEAVSVATEEFKAESPSTSDNRLLEMTKRALEAAMRSKMNGDQDWVSKLHIILRSFFGFGRMVQLLKVCPTMS